MATEAQIIEHLRKLAQYKERPQTDEEGVPYYACCGNYDDSYNMGTDDGQIDLAKALIDALDNGEPLPDLPAEDKDEDEDEDETGG